jgi:hypothetical protein
VPQGGPLEIVLRREGGDSYDHGRGSRRVRKGRGGVHDSDAQVDDGEADSCPPANLMVGFRAADFLVSIYWPSSLRL